MEPIEELENKLSLLMINTEESFVLIDTNLKIAAFNDQFKNLYLKFYGKEVIKGESILTYAQPARLSLVKEIYKKVFSGKTQESEIQVPKPDKSVQTYFLKYKPAFDERGIIIGAFVSSVEITDRKRVEEEKEFERRDKEALINSTNDSMWTVSKDFKLIAANNAFVDALRNAIGVTIKPGDNLLLNEYFSNEFISLWERLYKRALTGEIYHEEVYFPPIKNIPEKWMDIGFNPIYNEKEQTGIACYARNITETKKHEKELMELNGEIKRKVEELAISNKELEQFAYIASHDLQEPLRMITSFLTQLEKKYKDKLDEKAKQYIYFAVDGATRMRKIILDLLEYSRVDKHNYKIEPVSLEDLLQEIKILNQNTIEEKKAEIHSKNLPTIFCSRTSILQVLQNLIGNALKYQEKNTIPLIEVSANETETFWEIIVSDNGIGIDSEFFEKIFVLFQRLHSREDYSGSGIGLAICKKIIENHQGKLWVESDPGKGSRFHFTISKKITSN